MRLGLPAFPLLVGMLLSAVGVSGQLQVTVVGNNIQYTAGGSPGPDDTYCVTHVSIDGQGVGSMGNAPPCPTLPVVNSTKGCNWIGSHMVTAEGGSPSGPRVPLGSQTVTVSDPPAAFCNIGSEIRFDIVPTTLANDRRILLSNTNVGPGGVPTYPYPRFQNLLGRDKVIPINLRVLANAVATQGVEVLLQIIDPPDPSPYMNTIPPGETAAPGSHAGDNAYPLFMPALSGPGVTALGNNLYAVTSGPNGYIETEMTLHPDTRAGDNYQVFASATLPDGTAISGSSGVVTAWKRMFVEKRQMFRRGAPLAANAPSGVTRILVTRDPIASSSSNDSFSRNDWVMLMHAPAFGQPKTPGSYWQGIYQIVQRPARYTFDGSIVAGPGTVTTNGTTAIVGKGTRFTQLGSGEVITIGPDTRVIVGVISRTELTVDAPTTTAAADQTYQIGDRGLEPGNYYWLTLDRPLGESYQREPLADVGELRLNDSVVRLGASYLTSADYFDADSSYLTGTSSANVFPGSFTEYIALPSKLNGSPLPRMRLNNVDMSQWFINKWFETPIPTADPNPLAGYSYAPPHNHQLLVVGDTDALNVNQSGANGFLVDALLGERASVLNRATIESRIGDPNSPIHDSDADTILRRTLVHELVHQWLPNGATFVTNGSTLDHCHPQVAYDSPQPYPSTGAPPSGLRFCLMSYPIGSLTMPAPWNSSIQINMVQYHYRFAPYSFHMTNTGTWHSEYLGIRRRADPWNP